MKFMSSEQSEVLRKLNRLAAGDTRLVEEAIIKNSKHGRPAELREVVDYIQKKVGEKEEATG